MWSQWWLPIWCCSLVMATPNTIIMKQALFDELLPVFKTVLLTSINTFEMEDVSSSYWLPLLGNMSFVAHNIRAQNARFLHDHAGITIEDGKIVIHFQEVAFDVDAEYATQYGWSSSQGTVKVSNEAKINADVFFFRDEQDSICTQVKNIKTPYTHFDVQVSGSSWLNWWSGWIQTVFGSMIKAVLGRILKVFTTVALIPILSSVFNSQLSLGFGTNIGGNFLKTHVVSEPHVSKKEGIIIAYRIY